ncbi:hypothetical protein ACFUOZ_18575 [Paenarthrobacter sp. NPDC057355]|uniref:hypothetical protein n=1 Tax=Paenarthrobacter sp. NPDC057355 TaxID=3346105 RepID=UPI00363B46C9
MSYDLTVYCPGSPTVDQVRLLVGNTRGLHADPSVSKDDGVVVLRGMKRGYSFTVDGPFSVESEDLPEEITAVLPDAATVFQVLVEGTQEAEIPHGVRFARKLAKACHGAVIDEQTTEIWPQPEVAKVQAVEAKKTIGVNDVWLNWYLLEDDLPTDFLERYLRIAEELLPEAVPVMFGNYEPYQAFDPARPEGFINEYYDSEANKWEIRYKNPSPVTYVSVTGPELAWGNPFTRISLCADSRALSNDELRASLRRFFVTVASELGAVYASGEVVMGREIPRVPYLNMPPPQWVGFPPYPLWWVWTGPRLLPEIGPFLGREATEYAGGRFRTYSDEPLGRHQLSEKLGPENLPWIPVEYSGIYSDSYIEVGPLAVATVIPEILRNREPVDLPPGIYNPPRIH